MQESKIADSVTQCFTETKTDDSFCPSYDTPSHAKKPRLSCRILETTWSGPHHDADSCPHDLIIKLKSAKCGLLSCCAAMLPTVATLDGEDVNIYDETGVYETAQLDAHSAHMEWVAMVL